MIRIARNVTDAPPAAVADVYLDVADATVAGRGVPGNTETGTRIHFIDSIFKAYRAAFLSGA